MTDPGQLRQCRAQGSALAEKMPKIQGPILFGLHTEAGKGKEEADGWAGRLVLGNCTTGTSTQ